MTITQLASFLKIAESGSFTAAANLLGYAQSTVTTQIRQLEEELDCLLFERLGKSISLTAEGERLQAYAEKMLQIEREIKLEVPNRQEPSGTIRLGVSESLCYTMLPACLLAYKKHFPQMDIMLQFIDHDTFPALLKKGSLDIVCTLNPDISHPELIKLSCRRETLGFYAAPAYPLSGRKQIREKDLEGVPLLLTSHTCSFRRMLLEDLARHAVTPKIALETSSKEILKQFAASELGVAFMPDMVASTEVREGRLKRLDWQGYDFPVFSQVFIHRDKHLSRAAEELTEILSESGEGASICR